MKETLTRNRQRTCQAVQPAYQDASYQAQQGPKCQEQATAQGMRGPKGLTGMWANLQCQVRKDRSVMFVNF